MTVARGQGQSDLEMLHNTFNSKIHRHTEFGVPTFNSKVGMLQTRCEDSGPQYE